jgi:hypothetical protein
MRAAQQWAGSVLLSLLIRLIGSLRTPKLPSLAAADAFGQPDNGLGQTFRAAAVSVQRQQQRPLCQIQAHMSQQHFCQQHCMLTASSTEEGVAKRCRIANRYNKRAATALLSLHCSWQQNHTIHSLLATAYVSAHRAVQTSCCIPWTA